MKGGEVDATDFELKVVGGGGWVFSVSRGRVTQVKGAFLEEALSRAL